MKIYCVTPFEMQQCQYMTESASSALAKLHKPHIKQLVFHSMTFKGVQRDFFPPAKQALTAELQVLLLYILLYSSDNHSYH